MKSDNKVLIFSIIVTIFIIVSGFLINSYLDKTSDILIKELESIETSINNNQWKDANKKLQDFNNRWNKTENIWTIFTNHHEIDNISISLKNLIEFSKVEIKGESLSYLEALKHYISHIPEMEKVSLKNVF